MLALAGDLLSGTGVIRKHETGVVLKGRHMQCTQLDIKGIL